MALAGRTAACWALGALNEIDGFLHDAGSVPDGGGARIWLGFHHPEVSLSALGLAVTLLGRAARSAQLDRSRIDAALKSLWRLCRDHHPDYQARILMQGARARDIPTFPFTTRGTFRQYGWGSRSRVFVETTSNADGHLGSLIEHSKAYSKMMFAELGMSTPAYRLATKADELPEAIKAVGWPCVVKPISRGGGLGVTAGIRTIAEAETAFALAKRFGDEPIMIEAFIQGDDHRLMVIDGRLFAAIRREPSAVTGDGRSTVAQLIAGLNRGRSRSKLRSRYLRPTEVDSVVEQHLRQLGVSIDTVLETGRRIRLRSNANLSTGGLCFDATGEVHPDIRRMVEMTARAMGLATAGFDFITTDISKSCRECGALIEVNISPGADAMIAAGMEPASVASAILGGTPARIPIRLLVTPEAELPHLLDQLRSMPFAAGFGWVCGWDAAVGGMPLRVTSPGPWRAVETLLRHGSVQHACLVCPIEAIVRLGMPVDKVESVVLYRCDRRPLPAAWMKVLADHSGNLGTCSSWADTRLAEFATTGLPPG